MTASGRELQGFWGDFFGAVAGIAGLIFCPACDVIGLALGSAGVVATADLVFDGESLGQVILQRYVPK